METFTRSPRLIADVNRDDSRSMRRSLDALPATLADHRELGPSTHRHGCTPHKLAPRLRAVSANLGLH